MLRRRKWKSRRAKRTWSKKNKWLLILLIFVLFIVQAFIFVDHNLKKPLMHLAKVRLKQIATESINEAIAQQITSNNTYTDKLVDMKTNKDGKVTAFMLNYSEHRRITTEMITTLESTIKKLESIPEHIPLGQALGSPIVASFGPNIPVRLVPQGAAKVEISTRNQNVGINMVLVEVYARIIVDVTVIIPFDSEPELVQTEIPISYALVVGDVPMYYFDNKGNPLNGTNKEAIPPNISIPSLKTPESGASKDTGEGAGSGLNTTPTSPNDKQSESNGAH